MHVCMCMRCEQRRKIPRRARQNALIDPQQLPANRNVIYFPRNHFNIKRPSERIGGCVSVHVCEGVQGDPCQWTTTYSSVLLFISLNASISTLSLFHFLSRSLAASSLLPVLSLSVFILCFVSCLFPSFLGSPISVLIVSISSSHILYPSIPNLILTFGSPHIPPFLPPSLPLSLTAPLWGYHSEALSIRPVNQKKRPTDQLRYFES